MSDEIKEILRKTDIDAVSFGVVVNYINTLELVVKDTKDSYNDMLYELNEENEKNKEYIEFYKEMSNNWKDLVYVFKKSSNDYKSRIEKAIELIKEAGCYDEDTKNFNDDVWDELDNLLNILQNGSDNE